MTGRPGPCGCGCALTPKTSRGFSAVAFAEDVLGFVLIPWQRWLLIHALELLPNGRFRFRTVLVLVARQNGKTTIVEVKNLWKMFVLQVPLVIGTAQDLDTAEESWEHAVEIAEGIPELAAEILHVDRTNGKKTLRLKNGSRWKIKAASRRGGRGLSGDDVNLDELREHQNYLAWGAVTKTTMARRNAQIWAYSNAGDDQSVVLNDLREKAIAALALPGNVSTLGLFEWSAVETCDIFDPANWPQPNPSLGYTITEDAIRGALETDPEPVVRTEVFCIRVPDLAPAKLPALAWESCGDAGSQIVGARSFAVDVTPDGARSSLAVAGARSDGLVHGELVYNDDGTAWLVDPDDEQSAVAAMRNAGVRTVILDPASPARTLIADFERLGFTVRSVTSGELCEACGTLANAVTGVPSRFRHLGQQHNLNLAVAGAGTRPLGDGLWAWSRKRSEDVDISPLVAVTLAVYGHATGTDMEPMAAFA